MKRESLEAMIKFKDRYDSVVKCWIQASSRKFNDYVEHLGVVDVRVSGALSPGHRKNSTRRRRQERKQKRNEFARDAANGWCRHSRIKSIERLKSYQRAFRGRKSLFLCVDSSVSGGRKRKLHTTLISMSPKNVLAALRPKPPLTLRSQR
jgi:hypothetical protein